MDSLPYTRRADHEAAQALLSDDRHYIVAVARTGDSNAVVTGADIVETHGIKLLAKGTAIDSRVLDKLLGHRLREPIDAQLTISSGVTPATLAREAAALIDADPWWKHLAERSGDPLAIRHGLARLPLPYALCFKLTVARDQRPPLYHHSLCVTLLAHYLALRLELSPHDTNCLLIAALCHDLGELHTDPAILDPAHHITDEERHFVYVHPLTSYLILKQLHGIDPETARAVLHHQERLDGSGYPAGLCGAAISPLARVLTVADIATSVLARFADHCRLSMLLRLNPQKYEPCAVARLHDLLTGIQATSPNADPLGSNTLHRRLALFAKLLNGWNDFRKLQDDASQGNGRDALAFLNERIHGLNKPLLQFGFDPDSIDSLLSLAGEDREIAEEISSVLDETKFQFAEMVKEIDRRESDAGLHLSTAKQEAFASWRGMLKAAVAET